MTRPDPWGSRPTAAAQRPVAETAAAAATRPDPFDRSASSLYPAARERLWTESLARERGLVEAIAAELQRVDGWSPATAAAVAAEIAKATNKRTIESGQTRDQYLDDLAKHLEFKRSQSAAPATSARPRSTTGAVRS